MLNIQASQVRLGPTVLQRQLPSGPIRTEADSMRSGSMIRRTSLGEKRSGGGGPASWTGTRL